MATKEKPLSREDAKQLFNDIQKSVDILKSRKAGGIVQAPSGSVSDETARAIAAEISAAMKKDSAPSAGKGRRAPAASAAASSRSEAVLRERPRAMPVEREAFPSPAMSAPARNRGPVAAMSVIAACAAIKITFGILEYSGVLSVQEAQASYQVAPATHVTTGAYSPQEMQILTSLDSRRAELESRREQLDDRQKDLDKRDQEFTTRVTELRELSNKLKVDREKTEKKQATQLTQLANVYNAMNPNEAAHLIDQLDEVTAIALLQNMPEKRIGQILPLMSPERALSMTRMLSGRR